MLTKMKFRIFVSGNKQTKFESKRLSWHDIVGQLCDVCLHENKFYATKSQAI